MLENVRTKIAPRHFLDDSILELVTNYFIFKDIRPALNVDKNWHTTLIQRSSNVKWTL